MGDDRILDVIEKLDVSEGIRPGTLVISWRYGYRAYGSNDVTVDGHTIRGDKRRETGL